MKDGDLEDNVLNSSHEITEIVTEGLTVGEENLEKRDETVDLMREKIPGTSGSIVDTETSGSVDFVEVVQASSGLRLSCERFLDVDD